MGLRELAFYALATRTCQRRSQGLTRTILELPVSCQRCEGLGRGSVAIGLLLLTLAAFGVSIAQIIAVGILIVIHDANRRLQLQLVTLRVPGWLRFGLFSGFKPNGCEYITEKRWLRNCLMPGRIKEESFCILCYIHPGMDRRGRSNLEY